MNEREIRTLVREIIKSEFSDLSKDVSTIKKEYLTKDEVSDLIKHSFVNLFKYLWEKKSSYINKLA